MQVISSSVETLTRNQRFVKTIFQYCVKDKGTAARLRRADNPSTEYQSWEVLGGLGVDLEKEWERLPFATISAAIAKSKAQENGTLSLGRALAACYDDGNQNTQAKARLRRLLACQELAEACRILRPILMLIQSRVAVSLDYVRLLGQLRQIDFQSQKIKTQWAQEFYSQQAEHELKKET